MFWYVKRHCIPAIPTGNVINRVVSFHVGRLSTVTYDHFVRALFTEELLATARIRASTPTAAEWILPFAYAFTGFLAVYGRAFLCWVTLVLPIFLKHFNEKFLPYLCLFSTVSHWHPFRPIKRLRLR